MGDHKSAIAPGCTTLHMAVAKETWGLPVTAKSRYSEDMLQTALLLKPHPGTVTDTLAVRFPGSDCRLASLSLHEALRLFSFRG